MKFKRRSGAIQWLSPPAAPRAKLGPMGPDLNLVRQWKLEESIATVRTGTDPGGHELSKQMPWRPVGKMDDEELGAVYEYLTHLPGS